MRLTKTTQGNLISSVCSSLITFSFRTIDLDELGEAFRMMSGLNADQDELDEMVRQVNAAPSPHIIRKDD